MSALPASGCVEGGFRLVFDRYMDRCLSEERGGQQKNCDQAFLHKFFSTISV